MQGDVIAIYNEAGQKIYEYAYDAWGNMLRSAQTATGGSAANQVNPFRYRGYYYDTETGLGHQPLLIFLRTWRQVRSFIQNT